MHIINIKKIAFVLLIAGYSVTYANSCKYDLTLNKVLSVVKNNHPIIKMAVLSNKISDAELLSSQGTFDLTIRSSAYYNRYNSSSAIGEAQYANMYNAELELLTRYGIKIKSGFDLNDGDIKTPLSVTGQDGQLSVGFDAPLLRGAGLNTFSVKESLSKYNVKKVYNNYRLVSLDLLLETINVYWKWVTAKKKLKIEEDLLKLSEFRHESIQKRVQNGDLPPIDLVEVKQEIQRRKGRVLKANRYYQQISYALSWFLWDDKNNETINVLNCNTNDFKKNMLDKRSFSSKLAKIEALKNRPEVKNLEISKMIAELQKDFAENDLLPRLDLTLRAGKQYGDGSIDNHVIKGGIKFELPLQRREAKGRLSQFNLELNKISYEQKSLIQKIYLQVDDSISAINLSLENLRAVVKEVQLAQKMQEGENKKFELGDSTLFVVNRRERSTAESKLKLIDTLYNYYLALGYYNAVTGNLL